MAKRPNTKDKRIRSGGGAVNDAVRILCLIIVLIMTRMCTMAAGLDEEQEKIPVRIVLRPEKEEGEPDPDLTEEIRSRIEAQTGEDDPALLDRLCACVSWSYDYDETLLPPGEDRPPGESDIFLTFAEDPKYLFLGGIVPGTEESGTWYPEGNEETEPWYPEEETDPGQEPWYPEEETDPGMEPWYPEEEAVGEELWYPEEKDAAVEGPGYPEVENAAETEPEDLRSFLTTRPRGDASADDEIPGDEDASGVPGEGNELPDDVYVPGIQGAESILPGDADTPDAPVAESVLQDPVPEEFFEITIPEEENGSTDGDMDASAAEEVQAEEVQAEETRPQTGGYTGGAAGGVNAYNVPDQVAAGVAELIRGGKTEHTAETLFDAGEAEAAAEAGPEAQVQLLRMDSGSRETDLTDTYREALAGQDPAKIDWDTVLAPLPENDGTYMLRTTEKDDAGKETVHETAFSVNRFGSVYTYNDAIQGLRGKTVKKVSRPLIISEFNPDGLEKDSWQVSLSLDGRPVEPVLYTVSRSEGRDHAEEDEGEKETGDEAKAESAAADDGAEPQKEERGRKTEKREWVRYDYVISAENFREDGGYRLSVSSRDTAGNTPEIHRYNGGEIRFTVDASPPELQAVQGLEKAVVNGRKAEVRVTAFDTVGLARLSAFVDGKCMAAVTDFSDRHRAELTFSIPKGPAQRVRLVAEDTAGNVLDTDEKTDRDTYAFRPAFPFEREITVTPPPKEEVSKKSGMGTAVLVLLILGCGGASGGMLRHLFRQGKRKRQRQVMEPD